MEKIKYYYSAMSKQVFLMILMFLIVTRFILFLQVIAFDINGYAGKFNLGATLALYLAYLAVCLFFFTLYKCFYATFDENKITYYNRLLRKEHSVSLDSVAKAHLTKWGIRLYGGSGEGPCFYLPFFRGGIVSPIGVDRFYKLLKEKGIEIEKDFVVLPGQGKRWKWVSVAYTCLALLALAPATQTLALVVAIFKSH